MERVDEMQEQTSSADDNQLISSVVSDTLFLLAKSFTHLIPMLIGVLQVSSQGNNESPFKTHPVNMWIFLVATFIFCFAIQLYKTTSYFQPSIAVAAISGSLSSVSLVSIFLQDHHFLGLLIFIPWAFVPIIIVYQIHAVFIHSACHRLHQMVININISKLSIIWTWFRGSSIVQERQRLPV